MSTEERVLGPDYGGLISANTVAQSILSESRDERVVPEDWRTRRFGYNPGPIMIEDPVHSGLQLMRIVAGVPILFETGTVSRHNWSVDANDRTPPNVFRDLLAGEGLFAVNQHHAHMGFRELRPLRGLTNAEAGKQFYAVHPPLSEIVEAGVIEQCPYGLTVCVTCRQKALDAMEGGVPSVLYPLFEVLKDSVVVSRSYMADEWGKWLSEIAGTTSSSVPVTGLRHLNANHELFMHHLHERTPNDQELARISASATAQMEVMNQAFDRQARMFAEAMSNASNADVITRLQADNAQMRREHEELMAAIKSGQFAVRPPDPEEPKS